MMNPAPPSTNPAPPVPFTPTGDDIVSNTVMLPDARPLPNGRWPHYRLERVGGAHGTGAIVVLNGARRLDGDVEAFGVHIRSLEPSLAKPVSGMVAAPNGAGLIVTADDGGCFFYPFR